MYLWTKTIQFLMKRPVSPKIIIIHLKIPELYFVHQDAQKKY